MQTGFTRYFALQNPSWNVMAPIQQGFCLRRKVLKELLAALVALKRG